MSPKKLLSELSQAAGYHNRHVTWMLDRLVDIIRKTDRVEIPGLGAFEWVVQSSAVGETAKPERILNFSPAKNLSYWGGV